eukprot:s79_g10.t1
MWFELGKKRVAILSMVDECTRYMAARVISDEQSTSLIKALERSWIKFHGPPQKLKVDEYAGWGSDAFATWAENHDIELKISPGQAHTRTRVVERRHQLLRRAIQIYMDDNEILGVDVVHEALTWVIPSLNEHTFVNGFTPTQLAMGRQPAVPGLMSEERTKPPQLSEGQHLQEVLRCRSQAQQACAKADVDVRLRRALLRQFRGQEEDLVAGEQCLYWRESPDRFHTIKWKGPAIVVAIQLDPDSGNVDTYWLAHGTVLLRTGKHHVKRLVDGEGRMFSPVEAMKQVRQRRVVRMIDLHKTNKRSIDEFDEDDAELDLDSEKRARHGDSSHQLQLHGPAPPESPEPAAADDVATPQDVEILDSPDDSNDFHDAIEQMDQEIQQLEQPPDSPFSYAPTTPAETENNEPNDVTISTADLPTEIPTIANEDLPPVPDDAETDDDGAADPNPLAADNTLPASSGAPAAVDNILPTDPGGAEFRRRRRQMDQSETAWLRNCQGQLPSRRPHDGPEANESEQKRQRIFNSVEVGFYSMNGEQNNDTFPNDLLPEGWTYDEVTNSFVLGETKDFWSIEDGFLVRNHVIARDTSWRPTADAIRNMPIKMADLQAQKITMREGSRSMMVDLISAAERRIGVDAFFGQTLFPLTKEAALKFKMPYINLKKKISKSTTGFMENSPSEVWMAAIRPVKKKKDNEADLKESRMTVEGRLTFLTAKKAELQSIFENGVWQLELEPEKAEASRILKARFVLKWADDGKGGTKAKARSVLQGYSDPDLLSGSLETSSPTLNRTSCQVLLSIGVLQEWEFLAADAATAFLQGDQQARSLWCKLPKDVCDTLNIRHGSLMRLLKPIHGQADAPRAWYQVARRRLEEIGFSQHPLDGCLFRLFDNNGQLCCLIGLHVDDMLISGDYNNECYLSAKKSLRDKFNFKHWTHIKEHEKLDFCGCSFFKTSFGYQLGQPDYFTKIKPITIDPKRRDSALASQREVSALRAVLGALQWPSTQTCPHLGTIVSLLSGQITTATTEDLREANKALKFSKMNNDVGLQFRPMGQISDMVLVAMSDASWGIRREGPNQGGYLVVLAPKEILKGEATNYVILDWRNFRLPRVSRSSLNAESQACAAAMDSLEYTRTLLQGCLNANYTLQNPGEWVIPETALVVDAKVLYDSIKAEVPQLSGDKRMKIEIMVSKEKMNDCQTKLRWISSEMQYADGLTKPSARQLLCDRMRTHQFRLQSDDSFVAYKKKTMQERQAGARRYALSRAAQKIGGLAHLIFLSHVMPTTAASMDESLTTSIVMSMFLVTMLMIFLTGSFCAWLLMGYPMLLREPKQRSSRPLRRHAQTQYEAQGGDPGDEISRLHYQLNDLNYQLHMEQYDKEEMKASYERERETAESYIQVLKNTTETAKSDAKKYKEEYKMKQEQASSWHAKCREVEKKMEDAEIENSRLQDELQQTQIEIQNVKDYYAHEIEFHKEIYALRSSAQRYHLFDDCEVLMRARTVSVQRCETCVERRAAENSELDIYQQGYR